MSPRRGPNLVGLGLSLAGAAAGVAVGVLADRTKREQNALLALETPQMLAITPSSEHVVLTSDGTALHVEIDEPTPEAAREAARGTTQGDDPALLPTVVLTHGYCLSLGSWVFQRKALVAAGYRVISWDQRGHGKSGKADPSSYVFDRLGKDLKAVIDTHAPTGDLVLAGHSMGGMTILALGEQFPQLIRERVIGVAFIATSPGGLTLANGGRVATLARGALERLGPVVLGPLSERPQTWANLRRAGRDVESFLVASNSFGSTVSPTIVRYTADMLLGTPLDVVNDYLKTFDGFDNRPALAHFRNTSVLVFNGDEDILTPKEHSELIVEGIPGAEHVVVTDAGHVIMLEHPDLLNAHLLALVDSAARARAEHIEVSQQPRVRRRVTDVAKERRLRSARRTLPSTKAVRKPETKAATRSAKGAANKAATKAAKAGGRQDDAAGGRAS